MLGARLHVHIDRRDVGPQVGGWNIAAIKTPGGLMVPAEYVVSLVGRGAPTFTGVLSVRAVTADGAHEGWWPERP